MMSSGQGKLLMTNTIALVNFTMDQQLFFRARRSVKRYSFQMKYYFAICIIEKSSLMVNRKPIILRHK